MKKTTFLKTLLLTLGLLVGSNVWAVDVPTPVYFNNFTHDTGLTIQGSGSFTTDSDPRFGKVFCNAASASPRTNYLILPSTVFSSFTPEGGKTAMTISFWVNAKKCGGASAYTYAPLFAAYSAAPTNVVVDEVVTGTKNNFPMICLQSRGLIQINNEGWCDFTPALNKDGKNTVYNTNAWEVGDATLYSNGGNWLDDSNWHLYTLTLTASQATVYLDGVLKNQWNLDGETEGQIISGMFTKSAENLTYVSLGGNQAWNHGDNDAAFMFDDFAVYDVALSPAQITQIIADKNPIISLPASYPLNSGTSVSPFNAGTIKTGTNVTAFSVNNTTATAYFDSDTSTDGKQAYELSEDETITISFTAYHGWVNNGKSSTVQLLNSSNVPLISYTYTTGSTRFTDVSFGGNTADGFEEFDSRSIWSGTSGANGFAPAGNNPRPYVTTSGYNPIITMTVSKSGYATFRLQRGVSSKDYNYNAVLNTGTIAMDIAAIKIIDAVTDADRSIGISNLSISSEIIAKQTVTFAYTDTDGNSLSAIKANSSVQASVGTTVSELITSALTTSFYNADESIRYDYSSYTVTDDATTVPESDITVTLKFTPNAKFTYNVFAVNGSDEKLSEEAIASVYGYEGDTKNVSWSKYVNISGQWYSTSESTFKLTDITESGSRNVVYSVSDIVYFYEMENLTRSGGAYLTEDSPSYSGGSRLRLSKGSKYYTPALTAGVYTISIPWENGNNSENKVYLYTRTSGGDLSDVLETFSAPKGSGTFIATIIVPEGYSIAFNGNEASGYNNNARMDYMTLTAFTSVSKTISSAGWATYCSPYPLDFSSSIDNLEAAYMITNVESNQKTLVLSEITTTVPANTGLLLKGEGNVAIPVVGSSSTDVSGNKLTGVTTATTLDLDDNDDDVADDYIYVLMDGGNGVGFYKTTATSFNLGANTAYLPADFADGMAREFFLFEDEGTTTGIADVRSKMSDVRGDFFDLQGRKVAQPAKGLYIVNGKKVVIK